MTIFLARRRLPILCWLFRHQRRYVGVQDFSYADWGGSNIPCIHGWYSLNGCTPCRLTVQLARWACDRCGKMGEDRIKKGEGIYTVSFGMLVPDDKRWANYKA